MNQESTQNIEQNDCSKDKDISQLIERVVASFEPGRERGNYSALLLKSKAARAKTTLEGYSNQMIIGQSEKDAEPLFFRLDGASPHALIAGETGSGKSTLMTNMILDLMINNAPENMRIHLFDPKASGYSDFEGAPHLEGQVVTSIEAAIEKIEELHKMMHDRYEFFKSNRVSSIDEFNKEDGNKRLARHAIFIDEIACWFKDEAFKKAALPRLVNLARMGRAAGFHLILATARPDVNILPVEIRANLDTQIAFKVDSEQTSEFILRAADLGAEKLLGSGHGILKTEGNIERMQVGYIPKETLKDILSEVKSFWESHQ